MDMLFTLLALALAFFLRPHLPQLILNAPIADKGLTIWLYVVVPLAWIFVFLLMSVYDPKRHYRIVDELQAVGIGIILASILCAGLFFLVFRDFSRYVFVLFVILNSVFLVGWRVAARLVARVVQIPAVEKRVVIVGSGELALRVGRMLDEYSWMGLRLIGYLDESSDQQDAEIEIIGRIQDARTIIEQRQINDVVIALPPEAYARVNNLVLDIQDMAINMRVVPDYYSLSLYQATVDDFGGVPMIKLRDPALNPFQRFVKRAFDLVVATISLLLVSPLIVLIAIAIRLDSSGPVIFRQKRVGENGFLFDMYKFRTMVVNAAHMQSQVSRQDANGRMIHKRPDDPRVTRIGRILRRTSLDEILQLINVLKGDMSMVGPRPELPWLVSQYEPWQHKRFAVPQGITGWWQVNGRSDKPLHLHSEDDIYYVQNYSLWMDIYILIRTPLVVVRGTGAY
jgi:exopolysaccharide biosynthesis polyprenyl glycosylphosphotransferase